MLPSIHTISCAFLYLALLSIIILLILFIDYTKAKYFFYTIPNTY